MEKRTDLALEVRESFPEDDVEVSGVILEEETYLDGRIRKSTVEIKNEQGQRQMNKPIGNYITLEFTDRGKYDDPEEREKTRRTAAAMIAQVIEKLAPEKGEVYLAAGLGDRFATPDALGPFVLDDVMVNRHIKKHFQDLYPEGKRTLCAVTPGVMGQTGMETREILGGVIESVKPCCLLVVDSLASRSINRLCSTIQITDTGICPGAGIGNNRNALNEKELKVPVIAIGVPTWMPIRSFQNVWRRVWFRRDILQNRLNYFFAALQMNLWENCLLLRRILMNRFVILESWWLKESIFL